MTTKIVMHTFFMAQARYKRLVDSFATDAMPPSTRLPTHWEWRCTTENARIKLKKLYPSIKE